MAMVRIPSFLHEANQYTSVGEEATRLLCRFENPLSNLSPIGYQKSLEMFHLQALEQKHM